MLCQPPQSAGDCRLAGGRSAKRLHQRRPRRLTPPRKVRTIRHLRSEQLLQIERQAERPLIHINRHGCRRLGHIDRGNGLSSNARRPFDNLFRLDLDRFDDCLRFILDRQRGQNELRFLGDDGKDDQGQQQQKPPVDDEADPPSAQRINTLLPPSAGRFRGRQIQSSHRRVKVKLTQESARRPLPQVGHRQIV